MSAADRHADTELVSEAAAGMHLEAQRAGHGGADPRECTECETVGGDTQPLHTALPPADLRALILNNTLKRKNSPQLQTSL